MPSIYQLKTKFQTILRPIVISMAKRGITANQVTVFACLVSVLYGAYMAIYSHESLPWLLLPLLLFIRMALNAIDGMLAREHHMQSKLGAILNEMSDVISDNALYLPFALISDVAAWLVVITCVLAILTEMMGVLTVQIGGDRQYDGPMGKSDRAVIFGTAGFFLGLGVITGTWLNIILIVVILLSILTIYNRAKSALRK